jgi:hypothetical protein
MPGEFYDTLGEISGYAMELGDSIRNTQLPIDNALVHGLEIDRNGNVILIYGTESDRTFRVDYRFRITNHLPVSDEEVQEHGDVLGEIDVDLNQLRATIRKQKLERIDESEREDAFASAKAEAEQIETGIQWLTYDDEGSDLWDGFVIQTRLYPYCSDFGIKQYNETMKQVVGDGVPIASTIFESLDVLGQEQAPELSEAEQSSHSRTYQ